MKVRYLNPVERLQFELVQLSEEGVRVSEERAIADKILNDISDDNQDRVQSEAMQLLQDIYTKYINNKKSIAEPDELDEIFKRSPGSGQDINFKTDLGNKKIQDKILGGWLGRSAGCLLGKPIEKYQRPVIREILESNNSWPLENYFTAKNIPEEILQKYPWKLRGGLESLRENIVCMPEDDDLNYTMLNLHVLELYGYDFTTQNVGEEWLKMLPVYETFTAERVAYFNLLNGISPPESGRYLNPFREWIGAQIRADLWGYVCPGQPEKAAELAWRDARLSHVRNGIYGEMFFAAMIAAAFVEKSTFALVETGLGVIPDKSRFALAIQSVMRIVKSNHDWEIIVEELYQEFGGYHWVHTINNAVLTVAALLFSEGDYEKTICNAVMGGWDTDCNGATAGSIIGVILGAEKLPAKWIKPLNNRIRSSLKGFDNGKFTDLAQRTVDAAKMLSIQNDKKSKLNCIDDY